MMILTVTAEPTELGTKIGRKAKTINDVYDLGHMFDGTGHVVRCSIKGKNGPEREYIPLIEYDVSIHQKEYPEP